MIVDPLIAILSVLLLACFYALFRNARVYRFRMATLARISAAAKRDLDEGRWEEWKWRYEAFDQVSYERMFWTFWVWPLARFYPDPSFLDDGPQKTIQ